MNAGVDALLEVTESEQHMIRVLRSALDSSLRMNPKPQSQEQQVKQPRDSSRSSQGVTIRGLEELIDVSWIDSYPHIKFRKVSPPSFKCGSKRVGASMVKSVHLKCRGPKLLLRLVLS